MNYKLSIPETEEIKYTHTKLIHRRHARERRHGQFIERRSMKQVYITYKGVTKSVKQWEKETGIPAKIIYARRSRGWTPEEIFETPIQRRRQRRYEWKGKKYTIPELARIRGVGATTMRQRIFKTSVDDAMQKPNSRPQKPKKTPQEKPKKVVKVIKNPDTTQCVTCIYREKGLTCGYSTVTGRCRLRISPPSPNCTVYKKGKPIVQKAVLERMRKGAII